MPDKNMFPRMRTGAMVAVAGLALLTTIGPGVAHAAPAHSVDLPPMAHVSGPVHDIPAGGALPSEATCAARVQRVAESRPENYTYNQTRGNSPNDENPRVTGNFVGTTDEIIQWAACKWGLDPAWARAQALVESYWIQTTASDFGVDGCLPGHPIGADGRPGQCPQSIGLLQVRYPYHQTAFENNNAIRSSAYNADYAWSIWRRCFNGEYTWLNDVEHGRTYTAGDGLGCMGVWFSGRWYTDAAVGYMNRVGSTSVPPSPPTPPAVRKPSAPRNLTAAVAPAGGAGYGQVRLSWLAPSSNGGGAITDYVIQRSTNGFQWVSMHDPVNAATYFLASRLTVGQPYRFRVAARNSAGWGPVSNVVTATPRNGPPSAPRSFAAAVAPAGGAGSGQVRLTWIAPSTTGGSPLTDYVIQRSTNGTQWVSMHDPVGTGTSYLATGLTNGQPYRFRVAARNAIGWGPVSATVVATPRAPAGLASAAVTPSTTTTTGPTTTTIGAAPTTAPSTTTVESSGSIGDLVWLDADGDGRQATSEVGVAGVTVRLLDNDDQPIATVVTDEHGAYEFTELSASHYRVEVDLPEGLAITSADVGPDDEGDSDVIELDEVARTARTGSVEVPTAQSGDGTDIGLVTVPTAPPSPSTTTPVTTPVTVPTTVAETTTPPTTVSPTTLATTTIPPTTEPVPAPPVTTTIAAPTTAPATTSTTLAPA